MKRGWCPSLYEPMATGDGLLVRVKPPGGRLSAAAALVVADAAARFGNGVIELTQRGNLQVRGLAAGGVAAFAAAMVGAGLAEGDAVAEGRRAVMAPALLGDDPGIAGDAGAVTAGLEAAFAGDARLAGLPGKFAVSVDAGGVLGGRGVAADLVVWTDGVQRGVRLARRGVEAAPVGFLAYGDGFGAFGLAPPFGQMDAGMLRGVAALAARLGTGLRVTPWRALMLGRVQAADVAGIVAAVPGWIADGGDRRLMVTACVGAPGCGSGSVAARADARGLRPGVAVHVSGCAKGCAHPGVAGVVLVGREGRYDVVLNGRAGGVPAATGLGFAAAAAWAGVT